MGLQCRQSKKGLEAKKVNEYKRKDQTKRVKIKKKWTKHQQKESSNWNKNRKEC